MRNLVFAWCLSAIAVGGCRYGSVDANRPGDGADLLSGAIGVDARNDTVYAVTCVDTVTTTCATASRTSIVAIDPDTGNFLRIIDVSRAWYAQVAFPQVGV